MRITDDHVAIESSVGLSSFCSEFGESLMEGPFPFALLSGEDDLLPSVEANGCNVLIVSTKDRRIKETGFWTDLRKQKKSPQVVVIADRADVGEAVRFMRLGACDVLVKPVEADRLVKAINYALAVWAESNTVHMETEKVSAPGRGELVGISPEIQLVRRTIETIAPSDASVFIWGESGSGKELVARALHAESRRSSKPFVAVNCAALPKDILENELFGHERGAFTGALSQKPGCFEMANGGTLFLDEIGEMSTSTQAKLLRVLESQSFRRLGGKDEIQVDVRIVAATNRELKDALDEGTLRGDLYYRLSVVEMELPALRNRRDDILPLARLFLQIYSFKYGKDIKGFSEEYLQSLQAHDWPGNVRELRNTIERAVVVCPGDVISADDLPAKIARAQQELMHISIPIGSSVEEAEKKLILETLASVGNNKAKAARILGVSRKTLHNKLNSFKWSAEGEGGVSTNTL